MLFNFSKLKGRMVEKGYTQGELAKALNISQNSMSKKLRGQSHFSAEETCQIANLLDISVGEIGAYFFSR